MELTDERVILEMIDDRTSRRRRPAQSPEIQPASRSVHCACGKCRRCVDDARWERIYREKFADADYYADRPPVRGSSLSSPTT
jgi:hypothetical protein